MSANIIIDYWMEKARDDLASALENGSAGRFQVAVRDAYFCCFHAFSALLLKENRSFRSHKEVRSSLHRDYVRTEIIAPQWGKHFDWLFDNRQKVDYRPLVTFEREEIDEILEQSQAFLREMERLVYVAGNAGIQE
jgi:uncharacterized protein (UPF0332 family)